MTNTDQASDTWIYDHLHKVYFHPLSNNYAVPDPKTGQWSYIPAGEFHSGSSTTSTSNIASTNQDVINDMNGDGEKEEGEIEDDMGWGGLMDPDKLAEIELNEKSKSTSRSKSKSTANPYQPNNKDSSSTREKHPAYVVPYDDPTLYSFPPAEDDPEPVAPSSPKEKPNHILRLVVSRSECLEIGQVALIDTRENGIHIGRDRCEKGGQARIRLKEMPVSKTHSVIYWGKGGSSDNDGNGGDEEEEGWWIVDLGSTHGTFITSPHPPSTANSSEFKKTRWTRLSEPKHSSKPFSLQHQSQIKIGSTIFSIHIHSSWPCDQCQINGSNEILLDNGEPKSTTLPTTEETLVDSSGMNNVSNGVSQMYAMDSSQKRQNRELKRKREMALLKESLMNKKQPSLLQDDEDSSSSLSNKREYLDRSAMRRKLHPPSPPKSRLTTPDQYSDSGRSTSPLPSGRVNNEPTGPSKFASSILTNQGWTPGQGLGKSNQGRSEPILTEMRNAKKGLGAKGSKASMDSGDADKDWKVRGKLRRWDELSKNT